MGTLSAVAGALRLSAAAAASKSELRLTRLETWKHMRRLRWRFGACWPWLLVSQQIGGWLSDVEAAALYGLARKHTPAHGATVVELGSWKGKSSVMLAGGLRSKHQAALYCVDSFGDSLDDPEYSALFKPLIDRDKVPIQTQFSNNMTAAGVGDIVRAVRGFTTEVVKNWTKAIDLLFIDAGHEYESVLADFEAWSPFVKTEGVIAFHDVGESKVGPIRVVGEKVVSPAFGPVQRSDSLAWSHKLLS